MSEALDQIKAHYESLGRREIHVPEWNDLRFFVTPITPAERTKIYKGSSGDNDYGVTVNALIEKASDKDGKKLFTLEDRIHLLSKSDSAVLVRVFADIMAGGSPPAEVLKN
jgi:hypothetical protein